MKTTIYSNEYILLGSAFIKFSTIRVHIPLDFPSVLLENSSVSRREHFKIRFNKYKGYISTNRTIEFAEIVRISAQIKIRIENCRFIFQSRFSQSLVHGNEGRLRAILKRLKISREWLTVSTQSEIYSRIQFNDRNVLSIFLLHHLDDVNSML